MTTKECRLSDKTDSLFDEPNNYQYSNLNLNHNYQNFHSDKVQSKSVFIKSRKVQNYDFTDFNDLQAKRDLKLWNKSSKHLSSNFLNVNRESAQQQSDYKKSESANNSTLSLHIAAYENLIENKADSNGSESDDSKSKSEKTALIKKWNPSKQSFIGSLSFIQNSFEFPRQQKDQRNHPEIMQFKASQRLSNPNEEHYHSSQNSSNVATLNTHSNMQRNSFTSAKLHNPELSYSNKVYFNKADIDPKATPYVKIAKQDGRKDVYLFAADIDSGVQAGHVTFSMHQRKWTQISLEREVHVFPFPDSQKQYIVGMNVAIDYLSPPKETMGPIDTDKMAKEYSMKFATTAFTVGQQLVFKFNINDKDVNFLIEIKELNIMSRDGSSTEKASFGILLPDAAVVFDKNPDSLISLIGKSKGKSVQRALINPEWDFQKIGIGGLDKEFAEIFRRAFASRVFPPEYCEQLGIKHVRGILLYGPPGTGKTLIARQIGKMLNAREPKIVNGPEILNKYVGESEANMRKLFADAEEEYKRCGANSGLHMIIFDEIDAICKQRGSQAGSTGVHDTMVNQLLTKLDGVEQLNNILVIGMTNRKDMIDEALLRPGRMEVQLEISLADEKGRVQILKIHTARMQEFKYLADDVDIAEIARKTKNFSGAEIEGLVRAAQSSAMNRLIKVGSKVEIDEDAVEKLKITMDDFDYALEHDIKPAFGTADDALEAFLRHGLVNWGPEVDEILKTGQLLARETTNEENPGFTKAIFTGAPNTGKTYLASRIAKDADFPFIKVCTPQKMIGFSETAKCQIINRMFNDAYKSPLSILIIDDLERLMDYTPIGPRFSNLVLQALLVLLNQEPPKGHRLLVLATSSSVEFLREVDLLSRFPKVIRVRQLRHLDELVSVCDEANLFRDDELQWIKHELGKIETLPPIGIKSLLQILAFVRASDERAKTFVSQIEELSLGL